LKINSSIGKNMHLSVPWSS